MCTYTNCYGVGIGTRIAKQVTNVNTIRSYYVHSDIRVVLTGRSVARRLTDDIRS